MTLQEPDADEDEVSVEAAGMFRAGPGEQGAGRQGRLLPRNQQCGVRGFDRVEDDVGVGLTGALFVGFAAAGGSFAAGRCAPWAASFVAVEQFGGGAAADLRPSCRPLSPTARR